MSEEWGNPADAASKTLAQVAVPFGRLPAGVVAFVADSVLEMVARLHESGSVGLDLSPETITFGIGSSLQLPPPRVSPYYMLGPERVRGEPESPAGDLFSVGALLCWALTGKHTLDLGSVESTAQLLGALDAPPAIFERCPTIPGFLEELLLALLQPDPAARPRDAHAARALMSGVLEPMDRAFPAVLQGLERDAAQICATLQGSHADAEVARGQRLVADPATRQAAVVALLRADALTPGRPDVTQMLSQAADAGMARGARPRSPELLRALEVLAAAEPKPGIAPLRYAAELHEAEGDLVEAVALFKRICAIEPANEAARQRVDALVGPHDEQDPWAAGGAWTVGAGLGDVALDDEPATTAELADDAPGGLLAAGAEDPKAAARAIIATVGQMYGNLEPRSRLFLLAMSFGVLMLLMTIAAMAASDSEATQKRAQLHRLKLEAADCEPGGGVVLFRAWQASRLGEPEAVNEILSEADERVPMGTRCHKFAIGLEAKARMVARQKGGS